MGTKRIITGIHTRDNRIIIGEDLEHGMIVNDITFKRDAITGVTSGAPETYIYHVTLVYNGDGEEEAAGYICIPFREVTRIDYVEVTKAEEEPPRPEVADE